MLKRDRYTVVAFISVGWSETGSWHVFEFRNTSRPMRFDFIHNTIIGYPEPVPRSRVVVKSIRETGILYGNVELCRLFRIVLRFVVEGRSIVEWVFCIIVQPFRRERCPKCAYLGRFNSIYIVFVCNNYVLTGISKW